MTRIDFYILPEKGRRTTEQVLCSLSNKAWKQGGQVYIHTGSPDQSMRIDDLLWSFSDISFIPHGRVEHVEVDKTPVLIGHEDPPQNLHDIMINMSDSVPLFFGRFDRLIEIVDKSSATEESQFAARERYRFYKERGYPLNTHKLDN